MTAFERLARWCEEHPNYLVETSSIVYAPSIGGGGFFHCTISIARQHLLTRTSRASLGEAINRALDEFEVRHPQLVATA